MLLFHIYETIVLIAKLFLSYFWTLFILVIKCFINKFKAYYFSYFFITVAVFTEHGGKVSVDGQIKNRMNLTFISKKS